jgi:peroxiredoxin
VYPRLKRSQVGLYGVSVDSVFSHKAFAEQLGGLPYELLADFERKVVSDWGVRRDDVAGYSGMPQRSVFILDREGVVRWRWVRSKEQPLPDAEEVLTEAKKVAAASEAPRRPGARRAAAGSPGSRAASSTPTAPRRRSSPKT